MPLETGDEMKWLLHNIFGEGYRTRTLAKHRVSTLLLVVLLEAFCLGFWVADYFVSFRLLDLSLVALWSVIALRDGHLVYSQVKQSGG
jgi:hypothetical protein